jgi:uncharacterized protein
MSGRALASDQSESLGSISEALGVYRRTREQLERNILPRATSVDGLSFELQASLYDLLLKRGGHVVLESEGTRRLGQITELAVASVTAHNAGLADVGRNILVRLAVGSGVVSSGDGSPFHDAVVMPAAPDEVEVWLSSTRPRRVGLTIGEHLLAPGVPATLDSGGLDRHTFMCGQSGSGKTYSLGVVLERVLAETGLRVVILDPNSDYLGLSRIRRDADRELAIRYADVPAQIAVWRDDPSADHRLRLRFADLDRSAQAAVLGLDPVRDRDEHAVLADLVRSQTEGRPLVSDAEQLLESETPGARQLGLRALNLGVLDWSVWGPDLPSLVDELRRPTARCVVVDIGSLSTPQEQRLVAGAVLSTLWESRFARQPCLIVVDEAHNICAADPTDDLSKLSSEKVVQIAAEGRKYGLYLLTATQRPHKVHENVVSQCDNLLLMRMNSRGDLADLGRLLSFIPSGLMAGATSFRMGQALVGGKLLPQAAYVQMGQRVSEEGGADVAATWAEPKPH